MKYAILALIILSITAGVVSAGESDQFKWLEDGDRLKQDYIDSRKTLIVKKNGYIKGYLKRDVIDKRKIAVHDRSGNITGYLKKDVLSDDIVYESSGRSN